MMPPGARTGVSKSSINRMMKNRILHLSVALRRQLLPVFLGCGLGLMAPAQAAAPVAEKDSTGLAGRVDRIERLLQSEGLVDLMQQLQTQQQEISRLRGEVEVQNHTIEQMRERERALHADMDRRLQALESGGTAAAANAESGADTGEPPLESLSGVPVDEDTPAGIEADSPLTLETVGLPAAAATTGAAAAGTAAAGAVEATGNTLPAAATVATATPAIAPKMDFPVSGGTSDQADYDRAFWLLKQARHDEAIKAFRDYRTNWPKGQFSDNAQYWLGEGYHAVRNYEQALVEYDRLIAEFPNSQKITHAMLKSGYCLQEVGRADEARARLTDLTKRYPGTTAARLAEERLRTSAAATATP